MEIQIDIIRNDYANFNKYYFFHKKLKRIVVLILISALIFSFIVSEGPFDIYFYLRDVVFFIVFFVIFYTIAMLLTFKWIGQLPSKNGIVLGKKTIRLTDEGILEASENSTTFHKWKSIKSIENDKKYIYVFIDNIAAHVIPKRSFQTITEEQDFVKEIQTKMK